MIKLDDIDIGQLTNRVLTQLSAAQAAKLAGEISGASLLTQLQANAGWNAAVLSAYAAATPTPAGNAAALAAVTATPTQLTTLGAALSGSLGLPAIQSATAATPGTTLTNSATAYDVTSISLTPGTYLVWGNVDFVLAAATTTLFSASLSPTSATIGTQTANGIIGVEGLAQDCIALTTYTGTHSVPLGFTIVTVSATATVYLEAELTFSAGSATAYGSIFAMPLTLGNSATYGTYALQPIGTTVAAGSEVSLTTGTPANMTSKALVALGTYAPGVYLVWGQADFALATTTAATIFKLGLGTTTATLLTQAGVQTYGATITTPECLTLQANTYTASGAKVHSVQLAPTLVVIQDAGATIYLVADSTFTVSTNKVYGTFFTMQLTAGAAFGIQPPSYATAATPGVTLTTSTDTYKVASTAVLPAGQYLVWGQVDFALTGTTKTLAQVGISDTSALLGQTGDSVVGLEPTASDLTQTTTITGTHSVPIQPVLVTITTPKAINLLAALTFSAGTATAFGTIYSVPVA